MKTKRNLILILIVATTLLWGCGAPAYKRNPLQQELSDIAQIQGVPKAREWGDSPPPDLKKWLSTTKAQMKSQNPAVFHQSHNYLAISGGGPNGAFGAGLLMGWSERGDRPEFSMVTGVSTGALTAPFAFLGSDYDAQLKEVYTTLSTKDIVKTRQLLEILWGDAATSTKPLRKQLAKFVDQEIMESIAAEHRKGRRLYVGTTNLDAGRPVIWNIGEIADSELPNALDLIHDILLASASIPGAFPPVFIQVEADGSIYDEMHVDGGAASQIFLYPTGLDFSRVMEHLEVQGQPSAYLIRNAKFEPEWTIVEPKIVPIAGRTIDSMIRTQGIGDIYRIYLSAQRDGIDFNLAYIPEDFNVEAKEPFDPEYMGKLFDLGYRMAKSGYPWTKMPPGF
ncbi:patatin-like phospholipase family protein [Thermodesulfobacteriota bacterium]